jgi:hypothetical protein
MANREACELYIEQEIKDNLNQGKTPYSIGQELSKWVVKLFETYIPPRTIEQRARRQDATNVANKSNDAINTDTSENSIFSTNRGGKRNGAGRPIDPQREIDREVFAQFDYPISVIAKCEFSPDELVKYINKPVNFKLIENIDKTILLLESIRERRN